MRCGASRMLQRSETFRETRCRNAERSLVLKPVCYPAHSAAQTLFGEIVATVIFVIIYPFSDSISV